MLSTHLSGISHYFAVIYVIYVAQLSLLLRFARGFRTSFVHLSWWLMTAN